MDEARLQQLLGSLRERVVDMLEHEHRDARGEPEFGRLAADYRSYLRMAHPPARARRLADQILFQERDYTPDETVRREVALAVTRTLAEIYEDWLER